MACSMDDFKGPETDSHASESTPSIEISGDQVQYDYCRDSCKSPTCLGEFVAFGVLFECDSNILLSLSNTLLYQIAPIPLR